MKRFKKIIIAVIALILVFGIAACDGLSNTTKVDFESILASYLLKEDKTLVTKDFILDNVLAYQDKEYELKWKSDSDLVEIIDRGSDTYLCKISYPEEGYVTVTLTVQLRKATKEFTIRLKAIDVYDVSNDYVFPLDKKMVGADIELPASHTYINKTATITWEAEAGQDRVVVEDGVAKIYPTADESAVKLYATFELDGVTTRKSYTVLPAVTKTHDEEINYWYTNTGVSIDMSGYVVAIGTVYSSQYNNVTLYMIDDNLSAGYYLYRVKTDENNANLLVPGVHVTVTGTTNTNYNGLIETNAGGNLVVDQDKDPIDIDSFLYAMDEELIGNVPAAIYKTSIPVSLTNWQVTKVNTVDPSTFKTVTAFEITKGGVTIAVALSKYLEGFYTDFTSGNGAAIIEKAAQLQVGDYVTVNGILGNYKGAQIILRTADDIQAGEADGATEFVGQKAARAVEAVKAVMPTEVHEGMQVALPTEAGDVAISYTLLHQSRAVSLEENTLVIAPLENEDKAVIRVDYVCGEYSTFTFHTIVSSSVTPVEPTEEYEFVLADQLDETKSYLFMVHQGNTNQDLYSNGEVSGNYGASTENVDEAARFSVIAVEGGYQVKVTLPNGNVKYMNAVVSGNYTNVKFEDEATTVWTFNAEYHTLTVDTTGHTNEAKDGVYYVGTYNSYTTLSMSAISYISTSFPCQLGTWEVKGEAPVNQHAGTMEDPLDVADMGALAAQLDADTMEMSADKYYVKAVIATEPTADYCNFNFVDGDVTIVVYGLAADADFTQRFGSKREIAELPVALNDEVVLYGYLQNYRGKLEVSKAQLISINGVAYVYDPGETPEVPTETEHAGTEADPYTGSDAKLAALQLDAGATSEGKFYVKGLVVDAPTATYCNFNLGDSTVSILVYGLAADAEFTQRFGSNREIVELPIKQGDEIVVLAQLQNYNGTPELKNAQLLSINDVAYVYEEPSVDPVEGAVEVAIAGNLFTADAADANIAKYEIEGMTFVLDKASSTTANRLTDAEHLRVYKLAHFDVYAEDGKGISKIYIQIVGSYAGPLTYNGTSYAAENSIITIELDAPVASMSFTAEAQTRINKVTYVLAALGEEPENPEEPTQVHAGTLEDPLDVADMALLIGQLDAATKETSADKYYVKAVIATDPTADYCNFNFVDGEATIIVYGLAADADFTQRFGSKREITELPVVLNDEVVLYGFLQNYNNKFEVVKAQLVSINGVAYQYQEPTPENPTPENPAETTTVSVVFADLGWVNGTKYGGYQINDDVTLAFRGGDNTGKYYDNGTGPRFYASENGSLVIEALQGKTIVSVKVTFKANASNATFNDANGNPITSEAEIAVNATSVTFTAAGSKNIGVSKVEVVYK